MFLSFLDLILGGVFIAIGLIVLLDWQITDIVAWLPFVVVGGLLVFTTFLRSAARPQPCTRCAAGALTRALVCSVCGACAAKCCTCCIKVSVPLVLLICLLECGASAPAHAARAARAARLAGVPLPCPRPASTNERSR